MDKKPYINLIDPNLEKSFDNLKKTLSELDSELKETNYEVEVSFMERIRRKEKRIYS